MGINHLGCETNHSPPSSFKVESVWSSTFTDIICIHGIMLGSVITVPKSLPLSASVYLFLTSNTLWTSQPIACPVSCSKPLFKKDVFKAVTLKLLHLPDLKTGVYRYIQESCMTICIYTFTNQSSVLQKFYLPFHHTGFIIWLGNRWSFANIFLTNTTSTSSK